MRRKLTMTLIALALLVNAGAQEPRQEGQQIIDDFISTRGVVFVDPSEVKKPARKPAGKVAGPQSKPRRKAGQGGGEVASAKPKPNAAQVSGGADAANGESGAGGLSALKAGGADRPLALGYTLYKVEGVQRIPTDAKEFTSSELIRISLETNTNGYVYVFNTTDGAEPTMIYPHVTVRRGANSIEAHRRDYVPTDKAFQFDTQPGVERVYIVVARSPLAGVPSGEELVRHCGGVNAGCYWQPTAAAWSRLSGLFRQGGRVREGRLTQPARVLPAEPDTLTRGLRVQKEEPPPAVVHVNDSPSAGLLVATIDLAHK
jgi:Domain of unknown function (DUF4384)